MKAKKAKTAAIYYALTAVMGLSAAVGAIQTGSDVLTKLHLTPAAAKEGALDTLFSGSVFNDAAFKAFKALPPSGRAAVVRSGLTWIKTYTQSAEFKAAYAKAREEEKPEPPEAVPSADETLKKQKAEFEKQVAEMRKNMAGLDAETRKTMEEAIKQMQAQMAAMEKDPQQKEMMRQMVEMQKEENKNQYAEQLKVWEENYPADPRLLIKRRIEEFLELSGDVDYSAKLVPSGSVMRFADAEYEGKPSAWKLCFRAGKETTEAAREFARAWMAELGK